MPRAGTLRRAGVGGFSAAGGGGGGSANVPKWSSSLRNSNLTLSNDDRRATQTEGSYQGVTSDTLAGSGKVYYEFDFVESGTTGGWGMTANTSAPGYTHANQQSGTFSDYVGYRPDNSTPGNNGSSFSAGSAIGTFGGIGSVRFGVAIDFDSGDFWIRNGSSSWTSGDPSAGTSPQGAFDTADKANLRFFFVMYNGATNYMEFSTSFTYTTPSGFSEGLST